MWNLFKFTVDSPNTFGNTLYRFYKLLSTRSGYAFAPLFFFPFFRCFFAPLSIPSLNERVRDDKTSPGHLTLPRDPLSKDLSRFIIALRIGKCINNCYSLVFLTLPNPNDVREYYPKIKMFLDRDHDMLHQ